MKFSIFNFQFSKSGAGFTLIEAVVAVSVFAIASTSIVGVYLSLQRLNQASASLNALQQNARFVAEDISKIIRNGEIAYADYSGGAPGQPSDTVLRLIDKDGTTIRIYRDTTTEVLRIEKVGIATSSFSSSEVKVKDFKVFINPPTNPFPAGSVQPTATISMDVESNVNVRDKFRAQFQITLATRQYPE